MSTVNIAGTSTTGFVKLDNAILDVWTKEILFAAQPIMRFEGIAVKKTDLSVTPGLTIKFLKYDSLTGDPAIAETDTIQTGTIATSTISITVSEYAKALGFSELLLRSAMTNVLADASHLLGMHYAKTRDALIRDKLMTTPNIYYAGGRADRSSLTSSDLFDVDVVREAVERLATAKAPKFNGDAYVCFIHPHQAKGLRKDSDWVGIQNYAQPGNLLTGEIGRIDDVRFVETTQVQYLAANTYDIYADGADTTNNITGAKNATYDVYRAVIVGDYAVGMAEALPVEMRDDGVHDFGRTHKIAYYGIWGTGLIEEAHSLVLETV